MKLKGLEKCSYLWPTSLPEFSEEEFQNMQSDFMEKYYMEFEDNEECKFIYTDIHQEYVSYRLIIILLNESY